MLISVIIPYHNELLLINRAVKSVNVQFKSICAHSFEVIICNDGSQNTDQILNSIENKYRNNLTIYKNKNFKGPAGARNTGLSVAKGQLIAFLDADDYWLNNKIEKQLELIQKGYTFIATGYKLETSKITISPPISIEDSIDIFNKLGVGTSTVLIDKCICKNKKFRNLRFSQDIDYWYQLSQSDLFKYRAIPESYTVYSQAGSTRNKFIQLVYFWKVLRLNKITSFHQFKILTNYSFRGIFNHYIRKT